jgi:ribose/xylose/arabinose/galactoside ABC-type transport system permease subunit
MTDASQRGSSAASRWKEYFLDRVVRHEAFTLGIILVSLIVTFAVNTGGLFLRFDNVMNIMVQSSIRGVAAVGQALVILTAGIDLSVGGVAVLTACLGGSLITRTPGYLGPIDVGPTIIIVLLVGLGIGAINGLLVSRLNMPALIVTLAMWQIAKGAASELTTGEGTHPLVIADLPETLAFLGQGKIGVVPLPGIVFVASIVIGYFILNHTTFGKSVYSTGGNEATAWLSGLKTRNIKFWVYVISGLCASIAGVVQMSRIMSASNQVIGGLELDSIAAVVIGGVSLFGGSGSIVGVLLGVLIIGVINNGMNIAGLNIWMQDLVKGTVIFAAVAIDAWRRRPRG